jgi:structural maintenance of chromosome 2
MNNKKTILNDLNRSKKNLLKQKEDDSKVCKSKDKELEQLRVTYDALLEKSNQDAEALQKAQDDFEAISAGASRAADGDASKTLSEQLHQARMEFASLETEEKKSAMAIKHLKENLANKKKEQSQKTGSESADKIKYDQAEKEIKELQRQLQSLSFDEGSHKEKARQRKEAADYVGKLQREVENQEQHSGIGFRVNREYHEPFRGFNHDNILGMICELFTIKDKDAALALEVAVGGKLRHIVVKDQETAQALLNKGQLRRSFTFLPLNRIDGRRVDNHKLILAQQLVGKNNVKSAISLVDFEPHLKTAMEYAFGDIFICTDMETADKVAFDPRIRVRCVTLSGDDANPVGTLSGGSRQGGNELLLKMIQLEEDKEELKAKQEELTSLENELRSSHQMYKQYSELKTNFDRKTDQLMYLKESLENNNSYILMKEIEEIEEDLKVHEDQAVEIPSKKKQLNKVIKELEHKMQNSESIRAKELKEADEARKKAQTKSELSKKEVDKRQLAVETLRQEILNIVNGLEALDKEIEEMQQSCISADKDYEEAKTEVAAIQADVTEVRNRVNEKKKQLKSKNDDIHKLVQQKEKLSKDIETKKLEIRKLEHEIESIEKESTDASKTLKHLLRSNPWIEEEKGDFGNEKAGYPLKKTNFNPGHIKGEVMNLQNKKNALAKTVNMRANVALVDKEKEFHEVSKKRQIVEEDKVKLLEYMKEVDLKRKDELKKAFKTINDHLGSIFRSLLPGSDAKLEAPVGKTIHDGLEIRVAFGGVWKESLTELSGGQRSLVALSLVLALLRYNPAPIYILDEVDAALDQNHTTNIGQMIKANFPDSQV